MLPLPNAKWRTAKHLGDLIRGGNYTPQSNYTDTEMVIQRVLVSIKRLSAAAHGHENKCFACARVSRRPLCCVWYCSSGVKRVAWCFKGWGIRTFLSHNDRGASGSTWKLDRAATASRCGQGATRYPQCTTPRFPSKDTMVTLTPGRCWKGSTCEFKNVANVLIKLELKRFAVLLLL